MDALQAQAMSQETERRRQVELRQIASALRRIDSGDYGYCTECDEPIAEARLRYNPATPLCIHCAERSG
jgi:DnaK suppressor protein